MKTGQNAAAMMVDVDDDIAAEGGVDGGTVLAAPHEGSSSNWGGWQVTWI